MVVPGVRRDYVRSSNVLPGASWSPWSAVAQIVLFLVCCALFSAICALCIVCFCAAVCVAISLRCARFPKFALCACVLLLALSLLSVTNPGACLFIMSCPKEPPERKPAALAARPRDPGEGCTGTPEPELGAICCTQTDRKSTRLSARSAPKQEARSGQGALARRHTDGQLRAALLKTAVRWSEGLCPIADPFVCPFLF